MSCRTSILVAVLVAAAANASWVNVAVARPRTATPPDAREAFAQGKRLYDAGDKQAAVEKFKEAYRLSKNPLLLYNIGFIFDELGDNELAVFYYDRFLRDVPESDKTTQSRSTARDRLASLRHQPAPAAAAASVEAAAAPAEQEAPAAPVRSQRKVDRLTHEVLTEATAGMPLDVIAWVPTGKKVSLAVYYRAGDSGDFARIPMKAAGTQRSARIPANAVHGESLHYYIEVDDARGAAIARSGRPDAPHVVAVDEPYVSRNEDEDPLTMPRHTRGGESRDEGHGSRGAWKWTFTIGAAAFLGAATISYVTAQNYQEALDAELAGCTGDCSPSTDYERELDSGHKNWTIATYSTLGIGVASAGVATYLWLKHDGGSGREQRLSTAPLVGPDVVGAVASIRF